MKRAVNPQTGEVRFLVNNQWVPPAKTAVNPEGRKAYLVNNQWIYDKPVEPPEQAGVVDRMVGSSKRMFNDIGTGAQALFASDEEKARLAQENLEDQQTLAKEVGEVRGLKDVGEAYEKNGVLGAAGEVASQVPGVIAEQIPQTGGVLASAALGAKVGSVVPGVGTALGGLIGAGLFTYNQFFGANITEQAAEDLARDEEVDIDTARAAIAAAGMSAAEVVGGAYMLGKNIVSKAIGRDITKESKEKAQKELVQTAKRSLAGSVGKGATRGVSEVPVEIFQEVLNRWQSEQDVLSDEALEAYGEAGYQGLIGGAGVGALIGPAERSLAKNKLKSQGKDVSGQPLPDSSEEKQRQETLKSEQKSAEEIREEEYEAFNTRQAQLAQEQSASGQYKLNLKEGKKGSTPTTSVQGETLPKKQKGFDAFGRPTTPDSMTKEQVDAIVGEEQENLDLGLDEIADASMLDEELNTLNEQLKGLGKTKEDATKKNQIKARIGEIETALASKDVLELTPPPKIKEKGKLKFDPLFTQDELTMRGLKPNANITKQLKKLKLNEPDDLGKAAEIIGKVQSNPNIDGSTKKNLKLLLNEKSGYTTNEAQGVLDLEPAPVEAGPSNLMDNTVFDQLGIGKTAYLRKNKDVVGLDYTDPKNSKFLRNVLEIYRDMPNRSETIVNNINNFLETLPEPVEETATTPESSDNMQGVVQQELMFDDEGDVDGGVDDGVPAVEPAAERQSSESGMGVGSVGGTATAPQESAPGGVGGVEPTGLGDTVGGVATDNAREGPVSGAVTSEQATAPAQSYTEMMEESKGLQKQADSMLTKNGKRPPLGSTKRKEYDGLIQQADQKRKEALKTFDQERAANPVDTAEPVSQTMKMLEAQGLVAGESTPELTMAIEAGDTRGALQAIVDNNDGRFPELSQKIAARMLEDPNPMPSMVLVDSLGVSKDLDPILGQYDTKDDQVRLVRGAENSHTFLHEMTHAYLHRLLMNFKDSPTKPQAYNDLQDIFDHVKETRPDLAAEYGMTNLSEFASEAMSNNQFQMVLMGMPYKKESGFTKFVRAVRKLFKVQADNNVDNVLFSSIMAVDGLMDMGRQWQAAHMGMPIGTYVLPVDIYAENFKKWFKDSQIANSKGEPVVWYHGTSQDIMEFIPKQADAIFVSPKPSFSQVFARMSQNWMAKKQWRDLPYEEKLELFTKAFEINRKNLTEKVKSGQLSKGQANDYFKSMEDAGKNISDKVFNNLLEYDYLYGWLADIIKPMMISKLPSGPNIIPVYVQAKNPFDYANPEHIKALQKRLLNESSNEFTAKLTPYEVNDIIGKIKTGDWPTIENARVQAAIKDLGHDGFYMSESQTKNLAVYKSSQLKSVFNQGEFNDDNNNIANIVSRTVSDITAPMDEPMPSAISTVQAQPDRDVRDAMKGYLQNVNNSGLSLTDIFRQKVADSLAPLSKRLDKYFTEGFQNAMGKINPIAFVRQAMDHQRISLQVFEEGGLKMLEDGFWSATKIKDKNGKDVSIRKVVEAIKAFAEKEGMDYVDMKKRVSTVLEGMRLKELREYNQSVEALAQSQAADGDIEGAYKTRLGKIFLHKTNQEINDLVQVFESTPELQEIQEIMNGVRDNLIDAMITSGRISKETAKTWKAAVSYVPFERLREQNIADSVMDNVGATGIGALAKIHQLKGSMDKPVENVVDSYINRMAWLVEQSMRNSALVRTLDTMSEVGMATPVKNRKAATDPNIVFDRAFKDGKPVAYELMSMYDLAAFLQDPEGRQGAVMKAMGFSSRMLRTTVTATVQFATGQVIQDAQRVIFNSGVKHPFQAMARTLGNFGSVVVNSVVLNRDSALVRLANNLGIVGDYDFNPINPGTTLEKNTGAVPRNYAMKVLYKLEQVTKASDMAARLAVYQQTMKETGDASLAHMRARELINFNRRGTSKTVRALTHIVPFFNSYVQGTDLLYRNAFGVDSSTGASKGKAIIMFISRMGYMAGVGILYSWLMSGDEYYEEASDEVRDKNWILPSGLSKAFGLDQPFKLPVPTEFGFIFKSIPERAIQYFKEDAKGEAKPVSEAVFSYLRAAATDYGMLPAPTLLKAPLENWTNFSTFTGRELVPKYLQNRSPELQYTTYTSELAKEIGSAMGVSPIKVDNLLRGYFGLMYSSSMNVANAVINPDRPALELSRIPLINIGLLAPVGNRTKDEFYEFRNKVSQAIADRNTLLKTDPEAAVQFMEENGALLGAAPYVNLRVRQLRQFRGIRQGIQSNDALTPEEKTEQLISLDKLINEVLGDIRRTRNDLLK